MFILLIFLAPVISCTSADDLKQKKMNLSWLLSREITSAIVMVANGGN